MTATAQYPQNITFTQFRDAIRAQFAVLQTLGELYTVDLPKDELYQFYLDSYPEGTNQMYRTRLEYDGSHDKSFIRTAGRVVAGTGKVGLRCEGGRRGQEAARYNLGGIGCRRCGSRGVERVCHELPLIDGASRQWSDGCRPCSDRTRSSLAVVVSLVPLESGRRSLQCRRQCVQISWSAARVPCRLPH